MVAVDSLTEKNEATVHAEEIPFSVRWENRLTGRYYTVYFGQDLWGLCLVKMWGAVNQPTGGKRSLPCQTIEEGLRGIKEIAKKRAQRGYYPVSGQQFLRKL